MSKSHAGPLRHLLVRFHRLLRSRLPSMRDTAFFLHMLQEQAQIAAELDARLAAQQAAAAEQRRQLEAELAAAQRGEALPPQPQHQVGACAQQLGGGASLTWLGRPCCRCCWVQVAFITTTTPERIPKQRDV